MFAGIRAATAAPAAGSKPEGRRERPRPKHAAPRIARKRLGVKRRPRPAVGLSERNERVEAATTSVGLSERSERVEAATQKSRNAKRFCRETQNDNLQDPRPCTFL